MPNEIAAHRWLKPNPAFDIDRVVEKLVLGDFAGLGWRLTSADDPYLIARCYVGRAVEIAKSADRKEAARRAHAAKGLLAEIAAVEKAARVIQSSNLAVRLAEIPPGIGSIDPAQNFFISKFTGSIEEAKTQLANAFIHVDWARKMVRKRPRPKQVGADAFSTAFAEEMIYAWVRLTGGIPGPADKVFIGFVVEAFKTLRSTTSATLCLPFYIKPWSAEAMGQKQKEIDAKPTFWDHHVRTAVYDLASRGDRDRGDRYVKGFQPDGVGMQPLSNRSRRGFINNVPVLDDQETRRLISVMKAGGKDGRGAASVLWTEYELGSQQRRRRYDDLGFDSATAGALLSRPPDSGSLLWRVNATVDAQDIPPELRARLEADGILDREGRMTFITPDYRVLGASFAPDDD